MILYPSCSQKSLKCMLLNCLPLSDTSTLRTPNQHMMLFQTKFLTFYCVIFAKGLGFTDLVK